MFRGTDQERPVKFLNDLDRYITFMRIDSIESVQIVSQALDGIAKDWWYIHESDVRVYEQFKSYLKIDFGVLPYSDKRVEKWNLGRIFFIVFFLLFFLSF